MLYNGIIIQIIASQISGSGSHFIRQVFLFDLKQLNSTGKSIRCAEMLKEMQRIYSSLQSRDQSTCKFLITTK